VNGLTLLLVLALAIGVVVAWRAGVGQGRREAASAMPLRPLAVAEPVKPVEAPLPEPAVEPATDPIAEEQARLVRSLTVENASLRQSQIDAAAARSQLTQFADDRRNLFADLASARAETARYRALVVDIENNAPPPLLDGPNAPDDLKLIVGIGPVLERMLHQMGVTTYRQIARWSERDIDEFDARLPEFPGRIRRDAWVTQARELHQSKFGETLPPRSA